MDNESEQHNTEDTELRSGCTIEEGGEGEKDDEGKDGKSIAEITNLFLSMPYYFRILMVAVITILLFVIGYYIGLQNGFNQGVELYADKLFLN